MREYLYPVLMAGLSFLVAVLLAPIVIRKLRELHFGQKILEDGPTWHKGKQNTPTMGGVIFIIAMTLTVLTGLPGMIANGDYRPLVMLGLSLVFAAVGFVDDWTKIRKKRNQGLTPQQKMLLQIAAAVLFLVVMRVMGYLTPDLYLPFAGKTLRLPWTAYLIFSVIVIIGADNAVNLPDGIDGLVGSITFFACLFMMLIANVLGFGANVIYAAAAAGGCLGFLVWNFHPAKCFMGDTGSLFLGGLVCSVAVAMNMQLLLILIALMYLIEMFSVMLQVTYFKLTHGKRLFKMSPIHHHFEMCGWSEMKIVCVFSGFTALCGLGALLLVIFG